MNRAYKFRIYLTREQEILIHKTFGCCRFVYNRMLADKKQASGTCIPEILWGIKDRISKVQV